MRLPCVCLGHEVTIDPDMTAEEVAADVATQLRARGEDAHVDGATVFYTPSQVFEFSIDLKRDEQEAP